MGKNKKKYENVDKIVLFRYTKEVFEQREFNNFNVISLIDTTEILEEKFHVTSVPFVKKDTSSGFAVQEVDVVYFSTKEDTKIIDEKEWKDKSFNTSFSSWVNRVTVVVEKTEDKLKLSIFKYGKSRSVGHKYFKKVTNATHLTFNTTTNNFFITSSKFVNRKKRTGTVKNSYKKLHRVIGGLDVGVVLDKLVTLEDIVPFRNEDLRTNSEDYVNMSKEIVNILCKELDVEVNRDNGLGDVLSEITSKWYVKVREIKVPNEHFDLMKKHYPGIRKLKRFGMNLVDTILHYKGLKGKYYKKLLNDGCEYNLTDLVLLNNMVGDKRCKSINKSFLRRTNYSYDDKFPIEDDDRLSRHCNDLTEMEKVNLLKVLNSLSSDSHFLGNLVDHLRIKEKLTEYGANVKVRCVDLNSFNTEHQDWSNMVHMYERAMETRYYYDDKVIDMVESDVDKNGHIYNVSILKTDTEYYEEGKVQNHCVRTYVDSYHSMVISVRDSEDVRKRMTMEFVYVESSGKVRLTQSRMRFNKDPEGVWEKLKVEVVKRVLNIKDYEPCKVGIYNKLSGKTRFVNVGTDGIGVEVFDFNNNELPF